MGVERANLRKKQYPTMKERSSERVYSFAKLELRRASTRRRNEDATVRSK